MRFLSSYGPSSLLLCSGNHVLSEDSESRSRARVCLSRAAFSCAAPRTPKRQGAQRRAPAGSHSRCCSRAASATAHVGTLFEIPKRGEKLTCRRSCCWARRLSRADMESCSRAIWSSSDALTPCPDMAAVCGLGRQIGPCQPSVAGVWEFDRGTTSSVAVCTVYSQSESVYEASSSELWLWMAIIAA